MKEKRRKEICLDLSLSEAKKIRDANKFEAGLVGPTPNQMEWKRFGNLGQGVVIPDKGFTKQLKCLDEEFEVAWDWGCERWEIWKFPKNGDVPYHVLRVETKDKGYRELGADILLKLQEGNPDRFGPGQLVRYFEEMDKQVRRRKMQDFLTKIRDVALDSFLNIHCMKIQVPKEYVVGNCVRIGG